MAPDTAYLSHYFDDVRTTIRTIAMIVFVFLVFCVLCRVVWDVFRFGRDGASWIIVVVVSLLFAGLGVWLAHSLPGAVVCVPIFIAFAAGRLRGRAKGTVKPEDIAQ